MSDLKFEDLPDEIILKVMSDLETEDLFSWWKLSKRFRAISQDESLWPKGSFFQLILLWCLSDPHTLVQNHCS
jgi:hypothetical protein